MRRNTVPPIQTNASLYIYKYDTDGFHHNDDNLRTLSNTQMETIFPKYERKRIFKTDNHILFIY
jgi:hypothetical protein